MDRTRMSILVSGASGIVGYGILKSLKAKNYNCIGTTIYDRSAADCFSDEVLYPPVSTDSRYVQWLIDTIAEKNINIAFPGIELDMDVWNKNRSVLEHTGCRFVLNNQRLIDLCLDKWEFYRELEKADVGCRIPTINTEDFRAFSTPFIVKPKRSTGSKGFKIIHSIEEFEQYNSENKGKYIIQKMVGDSDEEYTIAGFYDKRSELRASICLKRKLSPQGFTEIAEVVAMDDDLLFCLKELAEVFKPVGPTDFQFRRTKDGWKLLEINPRISSSTSIRTAFGYNEAEMCIEYFVKGNEISQPEIKKGHAIRYTEDYIFYDSYSI